MPTCFFVTDLHGFLRRYEMLFAVIEKEQPDAVFIGGDILPSGLGGYFTADFPHLDFINDYLAVQFGVLKSMPLRDYVAATNVDVVGSVPMLDLAYDEDSQADVDMNVVMTGSGGFIEVQATAERVPFNDARMAGMIGLARAGIGQLIEVQKRLVAL